VSFLYENSPHILLQPFYSSLDFVTTLASRYQEGKTKTNLDFLEQETVSNSGISWTIRKSAPRPRQITMPEPQHSVLYRPDALPATQPTAESTEGKSLYTILLKYYQEQTQQQYQMSLFCKATYKKQNIYYYYNHFTALWISSSTTRVSRY